MLSASVVYIVFSISDRHGGLSLHIFYFPNNSSYDPCNPCKSVSCFPHLFLPSLNDPSNLRPKGRIAIRPYTAPTPNLAVFTSNFPSHYQFLCVLFRPRPSTRRASGSLGAACMRIPFNPVHPVNPVKNSLSFPNSRNSWFRTLFSFPLCGSVSLCFGILYCIFYKGQVHPKGHKQTCLYIFLLFFSIIFLSDPCKSVQIRELFSFSPALIPNCAVELIRSKSFRNPKPVMKMLTVHRQITAKGPA